MGINMIGELGRSTGKRQTVEHKQKHSIAKSGSKNYMWAGGIYKDIEGYVHLYMPSHKYADKNGYARQHRVIMERHIGRFLKPDELVHHINGIRNDNRIENLILFPNTSAHRNFHAENKTKTVITMEKVVSYEKR